MSGNQLDYLATLIQGLSSASQAFESVDTYALLPDPTTVNGELYLVHKSTGVPLINYHGSGWYRSDGSVWTQLADYDPTATNSALTTVAASLALFKFNGENLKVDVISTPAPTGGATSAKQDTGNTSVASIDTKTPALGQGLMAASVPVTIASNQPAVPVSASSLPLPSGAATGTLQTTGNTSVGNIDTKTPALGQAAMTASTPVVIASNQSAVPVSGTFFQATQPVSGTFFQATQPVSGTVTITPPTLTKGSQGATGESTQDLKDAGRTHINLYAVAVASGSTGVETAITLTKSAGTGATANAVSFVITSGKTFRITSITFEMRGNATATAATTVFNLRLNTAGAVITSSTPVLFSHRCIVPATASAGDRFSVPLPDGFEIAGNGTIQFGVTANAVFVTNAPTWDVIITGFEY